MAKKDSASLVLDVRRDSKQRAMQEALLVPWQQLAQDAAAFAERHMIVLWVRIITETAEQLPEIVRATLQSRCPRVLGEPEPETRGQIVLFGNRWRKWVTAHC